MSQGSAISPILFNLYLRPLVSLIKSFGISVVDYADDTQLVFSMNGKNAVSLDQFHNCLHSTAAWLKENSLQFNGDKTEVMYCTAGQIQRPLPANFWPDKSNNILNSANTVRNLGVLLDSNLQLNSQVNKTVTTCLSLLRALRKILPLLPISARSQVVQSVVLSRIDYCNALLLGAPDSLLRKLQRVQTMAAKLALNRTCTASASLALKDLHWLPVVQRVRFKALCIVFRALHKTGPKTLQNKFVWHCPIRTLRSANLAHVPRAKKARTGGRSFSVAASSLWNALPPELWQINDLISFKKDLKTSLFPRV